MASSTVIPDVYGTRAQASPFAAAAGTASSPEVSPLQQDTILDGPPEPALAPAAQPMDEPERPVSVGTIYEYDTYESGLPSGWTNETAGGATLTTTTTSPISGTASARANKASGGSAGWAFQHKNLDPDPPYAFRHAIGLATKNQLPLFPVDGSIKMHGLADALDGEPFAWLETSSQREIADLTVESPPSASGTVDVTLNGVTTPVSALGAKETVQLALSGGPTAGGTFEVNLGGQKFVKSISGTTERWHININATASQSCWLYVTNAGMTRNIWVSAGDYRWTICDKIRRAGWPGWDVSIESTGYQVYFQAQQVGNHTHSVSVSNNGVDFSHFTDRDGSVESLSALAARMRDNEQWPGWVASGSGNTVIFTADTPGDRTNATWTPGVTGLSGTLTTTQQGSLDTTDTLAARIRGTSFSGWTTSGSGSVVRFTATTAGLRQDLQYDPKGTGATGSAQTIQQGTSNDVILIAQDASGQLWQRKLFESLTTSSIFTVDLTCSGSGTARGIINAFGALGGDERTLLGRFEEFDLTHVTGPGIQLKKGVLSESSNTLTWDVKWDETYVTDRGLTYFRDHNALGEYLNQAYGDYRPSQPLSQDLLLQDGLAGVTPGESYAVSAFVMWFDIPADVTDGVPAVVGDVASATVGLKPLAIFAVNSNGDFIDLGDVTDAYTGGGGVTGDAPSLAGANWMEATTHITVPPNCYVLYMATRNVTSGQVAVQEVALSEGFEPKRTGLYAAAGTYITTFDVGTPELPNFITIGRERRRLESNVTAPVGTSATTEYRSKAKEADAWQGPVTDPDLVPNHQIIETSVAMSGNQLATPVLELGYPLCEYILVSGISNPVGTLLDEDRSEILGGTIFSELEEWSDEEATVVTGLPSGRIHKQPLPFGHVWSVDASVLQVFTPEAKRYITHNWNRKTFVIEAFGEWARVKLSSKPKFTRMPGSRTRGVSIAAGEQVHAVYLAQLGPCEVVDHGLMP